MIGVFSRRGAVAQHSRLLSGSIVDPELYVPRGEAWRRQAKRACLEAEGAAPHHGSVRAGE